MTLNKLIKLLQRHAEAGTGEFTVALIDIDNKKIYFAAPDETDSILEGKNLKDPKNSVFIKNRFKEL